MTSQIILEVRKKAESTEIKLWKAYQDCVLLILCLNAVHRAADRRDIGQFPLEPFQILPNLLASTSRNHRSHTGELAASTLKKKKKKKKVINAMQRRWPFQYRSEQHCLLETHDIFVKWRRPLFLRCNCTLNVKSANWGCCRISSAEETYWVTVKWLFESIFTSLKSKKLLAAMVHIMN